MGFLHGVLESVKNENEVTTYDNNPAKNINKLISDLTKNIGSGRDGLAASVEKVKEWLGKYNDEVETKSKAVKTPLENLMNGDDDKKIPKLLESIREMQNKAYESVATKGKNELLTWISNVKGLPELSAASVKELKKIDGTLQKKLHAHITVVDQAVKDFVASADLGYEGLLTVNSEVSMKLTDLKMEVNETASKAQQKCISVLETEFEKKIKNPIDKLKTDLGDINKNLNEWIQKAEEAVNAAVRKCTEILGHVKDKQQSKTWQAVEEAAGKLEKKARKLYDVANSVSTNIGSWVGTALRAVNEMDTKLKVDLKDVKTELDTVLKGYVTKYVSKVQGMVNEIRGGVGTKEKGLEQIVSGVKAYVAQYGTGDEFRQTVEQWVEETFKNELVISLLSQYVDVSHFPKVQAAIIEDMNSDIENLQQQYAPHIVPNDIAKTLTSIQGFLTEFSERLKSKNGNDQFDGFTQKLHAALDEKYIGIFKGSKKFNLQTPMRIVLPAIASTANHVAGEISDLINGCNVGYVDNALASIGTLESGLREALSGGSASKYDPSSITHTDVQLTDGVIATVEDILNKKIGEVDRSFIRKLSKHFAEYGRHINQDASNLQALADGELKTTTGENKLPKAIKGIQDKIYGDDHLGKVKNQKADTTISVTQHANLDSDFYSDTFRKLCEQVNEELKTLCDEIHRLIENEATAKDTEPTRKAVKDLLRDLRTMLNDGTGDKLYNLRMHLREIQNDIQNTIIGKEDELAYNVPATFNDILNACGMFYGQTINEKVNACITDIKQTLQSQVTEKIKTLQNSALSQFAQSKVAALQKLKELVERENETIEHLIHYDSKTNIKGLLTLMKEHLMPAVSNVAVVKTQPSINNKSPLNDASKELNKGFKDIIGKMEELREEFAEWPPELINSDSMFPDSSTYVELFAAMDTVLTGIMDSKHFDHTCTENLHSLTAALSTFAPTKFGERSSPILQAFEEGLSGLARELGKAYVNRYSGKTLGELVRNSDADRAELTKEGRDCAKTCLTLLEILDEDLSYLKDQCDSKWSTSRICSSRSLGAFMQKCGYRVAVKESDQNGELQNKTDFTGSSIHGKLVGSTYGFVYHQKEDTKFQLENLYLHLNNFYQVGHIAASLSTRRPCSISDILIWLTSLRHSPVYFNLITDSFSELFDKREKKKAAIADDDFIEIEDLTELSLAAYPQKVMHSDLTDALVHVIGTAPMMLTTIVGYGDEYTTYAVDYRSNASGFAIPSSASSCLSMLLELMRRLFPVFRFLHSRCSNLSSEYGWYHCAYGSNVESAGWQCEDHSKTDVDCLPRSPLMSYLRDTLPGHLPHQLISVDCKSECKTCPKSTPGMPCITPLGFKGFSGSKRTGKDIRNVLTKFFDKGVASCLLSLSPRPPSSLPEHYAFALSFVKGWSHNGGNGLKKEIESTMQKASIDLYSDASPLTEALRNAYGEARDTHVATSHTEPKNANVSSLSMRSLCNGENHCGPYLSTLYSDTYPYFGNKHCNAYMSWSVYLPWTFWQQLNSLYNAFLQIFCQDWGCTGCLRGDTCKKGTHGMLNPDVPGDGCHCPSIVGCKGVGPTLYQYGFTFQDVHCLISNQTKCFNLRNQLFSVLHSQYFKDLFKECDELLWIIRQPFTYLVLALWSLSVFYLICVMVGRLDVLHIRSHLRIPSSHKITAQSLLAAAQVGRLAKISYLQP